jgi:5-methylcytosine-specific restriction endonuclease McrA
MKEVNLKTWLIPKLRRISYMWPARNEAKRLARVERGKYKCKKCSQIFGPKEVVLDHINPVVPLTGFENLGNFVESLFCKVEGFQVLCEKCHDKKTDKEDKKREKLKKALT